MPWHTAKSDSCPIDKPWAVLKDADGSVVACHQSEESAQAQVAALYASESDRATAGSGYSARDLVQSDWGEKVRAVIDAPPTVHMRAVDVDAIHRDGTVEGLLVPWDSPAWVADDLPGGKQDIYREGFRRSAFDGQFFSSREQMLSNAPRVMFRHMHSRSDGFGPLGIGREFEVRDDGLWAAFKIISAKREMLSELVDGGIRRLSIEFREQPGGTVEDDGIRWRTDARLSTVALEWAGAYPEAQVLAMRAALDSVQQKQAEDAAERERMEAEARIAAAQAEAERVELDAAVARHRRTEEMAAWLAEQEREQASLAARYG